MTNELSQDAKEELEHYMLASVATTNSMVASTVCTATTMASTILTEYSIKVCDLIHKCNSIEELHTLADEIRKSIPPVELSKGE